MALLISGQSVLLYSQLFSVTLEKIALYNSDYYKYRPLPRIGRVLGERKVKVNVFWGLVAVVGDELVVDVVDVLQVLQPVREDLHPVLEAPDINLLIKHAAADSDDIYKRSFSYLLAGDNQLGLLCAVARQPGGAGHAGRVWNGHLLDAGVGRVHHQGLDLELLDTVNVLNA